MKNSIFIIENNCERASYLTKALVKDDYEVADYPISYNPNKRCIYVFSPAKKFTAKDYDNILPSSVVFGGNIINKQAFLDKNCLYFSFMDDKEFVKNNSIITAEATSKIITENTKIAMYNTSILVLGYGNLAKSLQDYLSTNAKNIAFASFEKKELEECPKNFTTFHDKEFCKYLDNFDVIINTIPKILFTQEDYKYFNNQPLFIDLASLSCFAQDKIPDNINFIHARNLPSIIAPKTAGEELKKSLLRFLRVIQ